MENKFNKLYRFLTLLSVLLFGIGQMWAADPTHESPATVTYAERTFLDAASTPGNAGTDNVYLNYGVQVMNSNYSSWSWFNVSSGVWSKSNNSYSLPTGAVGFCSPGGSSSSEFYGNINFKASDASKTGQIDIYVTGIEEVGFVWTNNNTSNNRWMNYSVTEIASDGTDVAGGRTKNGSTSTTSVQYDSIQGLSHSKYYRVSMWTDGGSASKVWTFTFKRYTAPACTAPTGVSVGGGGEYTVGGEITLEGSATDNVGASTTYTWYKGDTWDAAKVTTPVQAAATAAAGGNTFTKTAALDDAGTYWCSIANSTCEAHASAVVTVVPAGGTKYDITYNNTKGASNSNPAQYTEGVGIASFAALPDVDGFHFSYWDPASIAADASGNKTITAHWVPTYDVSFDAGLGSGTVPTGFQKWEGATFELPGQGEMVAPSGRVFGGWKVGVSDKYAAGDTYTMGTTGVEFVAQWSLLVEQVLYSWEGAEGGATETGGTVSGSAENLINQPSAGYYCLKIDGNNSYSGNLVTITLSGEEKVKTGDKITYWGFYNKSSSANARPKMRDANGSNAQIFDDGTNLPNLYSGGDPAVRTFTVPEGINTNAVQLTRSQTGSNTWIPKIQITREKAVPEEDVRTVTFNTNGGSSIAAVSLEKGTAVARPADPTKAHCRFAGWQLSGSDYNFSSAVNSNITLDAVWTQLYTVTYAKGEESATGTAPTQDELAAGEKFTVAANTFTYAGHDFSTWNDGLNNFDPGMEYTMGSANVTLTAQWIEEATKYEITKGTHTNGNITIDLAEQSEGGTVTLTATPDEDYVFDAWDVYKTGESSTKVIVAGNNTFTMPAYAVTVNATFVADPRAKVLYLTTTAEATVKANDKLYAALKDLYNVKIAAPASQTLTDYALVVLHESIGGTSTADAVVGCKTTSVPVLNTKSYFYNDGRWSWGTPNAGQSVKGATLNSATYCNIADHPLFSGVTVTTGFFEITDDAAAKCMQPVGSFTSGYDGYTLATSPNADSGNGCAIHEIPAGTAARGVSSGKYLMISVSSAKLDALNANGQKLFQNAAAYLIGSSAWDPIEVPTEPGVSAVPTAAYSVGDNISLTAVAGGTSASTTYTWYKGDTWAAAEEAGAIKAAATAAAGGNTYSVTGCVLGDAGTYWCVMYNGPECEAKASVVITVSDVSYDIAFVSAHGTAPDATTGVSYALPELTESGWEHQGWTANVDVIVDAEPVTAGTLIANGKTAGFSADVVFTAVWAQEFQVSFNLNYHGDPIAPQNVTDGGKATEPDAPFEIGQIFGGWFTDAECTAGNEFDFNTAINAATELFAKWTAFSGCVELWPATSGDAPSAVGDVINMQSGSKGATMTALANVDKLTYTANGLQFGSTSGVKTKVVLNNDMSASAGTKISLTLVAAGTGTRGLFLYDANGNKIDAFTCWVDGVNPASNGAEETFTYTVVENDGLDGSNEFQLWRNNTVILKTLKVESCGGAITYHNLTSAVDPAGKGTVTIGAGSVREGYTTTAEYSAIDAAYEFDEWQISGTGASITDASANPAVITMGTADAVVTLKLKAATPKHTVSYDVMGHGVAPASEDVKEGAKVTEPVMAEPEGWIFEGWYKENTLDNEWIFTSDVMGTADITLYAKWTADTSIKLINKSTGAINTTNFTTAVTASDDVDGEKGAEFTSARTALNSVSALGEMVQYNATTNKMKIKLSMYNTSTAEKTIYLFKLTEGAESADVVEIPIDGSSRKTTEYYEFNSDDNRSFYVTVSDKKVQILQVSVIDDGTAIHQFGQVGYSLNMNKGRMFAKNDGNAYPFEGGAIKVSSDYKVLNNSNLATKSYIQFNNPVANTILKVTRSGGTYYVSQDPENKGTSYNTNQEIVLTATGTWYLGSTSSGSSASFTKIEFIAPKCEAPAFNALANSDICSGDAYVALDGTGSVSDGGSISYKWYAQGDAETVLATTATYTPAADGNYYVVALHHVDGYTDNEATSDVVTVTTHAGTAITAELADQRGNVDDVVTLEVAATGKNVHYAWKESATIDGTYTAVAGAADAASLNVTITDGMDKYYKVVVSSDCGADQESVAHVTQYVEVAQADVTGSIAWNWANAASVATIQLTSSTSPKKNEGFVMANGAATIYNNANFESDKLYLEGEYIVRDGKYFQGQTIKFNTTVAGAIRVKFSHTGNATEDKPARELYINGVATGEIRDNATAAWSGYIEVPAGEVSITAYYVDPVAKPGQQYIRVPEIEFLALTDRREAAWVAPGELGTVCLKDDAKAIGANVYELVGCNASGYMVFDQITNGEIEAGKPYLFEATRSGNVSFYKTVGANHTETAATENTMGMYGTFTNLYFYNTDESIYYFSGRHIWAMKDRTAEITVPAYRCYVDYDEFKTHPVSSPAPLPGRMRMTIGVNGKNTPTGVENVQGDKVQSTKVLIDGQLFILRGEKIFDATGRLVK